MYVGLSAAGGVILLIAVMVYSFRRQRKDATTTAGGRSNGTTTSQVVAIPIVMDVPSVPIIEPSSPQEENPDRTRGQTTEEEEANGATTISPVPQQVKPDVEAFA